MNKISKTCGLFTLLVMCFLATKAQEKKTFKGKTYRTEYVVKDGRLHGEYASFYANGKKKAQGSFENNYRIGKWMVWDSNGIKRVERMYSSPFEFERLVPEVPQEGPIPLLSEPIYQIKYNSQDYIDYFQLEEGMIVWAKRIWRTLEEPNNPALFNNDWLYNSIINLIENSKVKVYSAEKDLFQDEINLSSIHLDDLKLIRFKLKEEWFFDSERLVMECRILGICPVVQMNGQTKDLCWLYFPELRPHFAKINPEANEMPEHINSLDDLFFFRFFGGTIYKESNVYNQVIADYVDEDKVEKEAERIEMSIIELEHDTWIDMTDSNL